MKEKFKVPDANSIILTGLEAIFNDLILYYILQCCIFENTLPTFLILIL